MYNTNSQINALIQEFKENLETEFNLEELKKVLREEFNKNKVRLEKDEQILITEYTKIFEEKLVLANFEFETLKIK